MSATALLAAERVRGVEVRDAEPEDNAALVELAAACPMRGDIALRMERGPDFFALERLDGGAARVGVAERDGVVIGCIAASRRLVYLDHEPTITGYVGDLKVLPDHRDAAAADALCLYATDAVRDLPEGTPTLVTVLAGNKAMERRLPGPRGLPRFQWLATLRAHSVSVLWKRRAPDRARVAIDRARWTDLDEMVSLWRSIAPVRQFAPVLDAAELARWIGTAPGLDISSYLVARASDGRIVGFMATWDQTLLKRMHVESYSRRLAAARAGFNLVAPLIGSERMPAPGGVLKHQTAFNVCVPAERPEILRALVIHAHNELRGTKCSFFNVGLDLRDPLTTALEGLLAQPTDVNAYVSSIGRAVDVARLQSLPLHYEIALV